MASFVNAPRPSAATWSAALEAYQRFDPNGWLGVQRLLGPIPASLLAIVGVALMVASHRQAERWVAAFAAGVSAYLCAPQLAQLVRTPIAASAAAALLSGGAFVAGALSPPTGMFIALGVPAGLLFGSAVGKTDFGMGFIPGMAGVGLVGALFHRAFAALLGGVLGAWLFCLAALALLTAGAPAMGAALASHPLVVLAVASALALSSVVFQLSRPDGRTAAFRKGEREAADRAAREKKAIEDRWKNYSERQKR